MYINLCTNTISTLHTMVEVSLSQITLKRVAVALTTLLICDAIWFHFTTNRLYPKLPGVQIAWGLIAWIALAKGVSAAKPLSAHQAVLWGASVGAICYSVFNGTELAIRPSWTLQAAVGDTLWGTLVCGFAGFVVYKTLQ